MVGDFMTTLCIHLVVVVKTVGIPFVLIGAPPILVYFSGDWDVHWGYGLLTHGHFSEWGRGLITNLTAFKQGSFF